MSTVSYIDFATDFPRSGPRPGVKRTFTETKKRLTGSELELGSRKTILSGF